MQGLTPLPMSVRVEKQPNVCHSFFAGAGRPPPFTFRGRALYLPQQRKNVADVGSSRPFVNAAIVLA